MTLRKNKVVRNKGRDMIGDYYKTNREIDQAQRQHNAEQKGKVPWTKREKGMLSFAIILLIGVVIRYFVF